MPVLACPTWRRDQAAGGQQAGLPAGRPKYAPGRTERLVKPPARVLGTQLADESLPLGAAGAVQRSAGAEPGARAFPAARLRSVPPETAAVDRKESVLVSDPWLRVWLAVAWAPEARAGLE